MRVSKMALVATALSMLAGCAGPVHDRPAADERQSGRDSLWHPEQIVSGRPYYCGDTPVIFDTQGPHEQIIVAGTAFDLKPVVSASGARYESLDGTDTGFWSKGDRARLTVRGVDLPACRAVAAPELPFTARARAKVIIGILVVLMVPNAGRISVTSEDIKAACGAIGKYT